MKARRYVVEYHDAGLKPVVSTAFDVPEDALTTYAGMLEAAGHSATQVRELLRTWTCVLMKGGDGFTATDPDLRGSISIRITQ